MPISGIGNNTLGSMLPTPGSKPKQNDEPGADFGSMLKQAIGSLGNLGAQADSSTLKLATGQPVDIHEVMLNGERASLGFQLALQVRDKLVNAYQEVMRMSI
jgi:flagellar hook-basal body complex protein FliE